MTLTRRSLLAAGLAVPLAPAAGAGRVMAGPARLTLPAPTGPHQVGTVGAGTKR